MNREQIKSVLSDPRLDIPSGLLTDDAIQRVQTFCELLQKWNRKINLTSENDPQLILENHVFDSLQYLRWLDPSHRVIDIGSGGGFPGIPVKIFMPAMEITLLESQRKRCSFLREASRSLGLSGVEVAEGRAEDIMQDKAFLSQYDRATFRGFSSLDACLEAGLPFLKPGGQVILMKSPGEIPSKNSPLIESSKLITKSEVQGFQGKTSIMMVLEKCSTWNTSPFS